MKRLGEKFSFASPATLALILTLSAGVSRATTMPGSLPLFFEADSPARFIAHGRDYEFLISPVESRIVLRKSTTESAVVRMRFIGADAQAQIVGDRELRGKINRFIGSDPAQWRSGVPTFANVRVAEIYHGISLIYHGNQQQLEYDFVVAPGANPDTIKLQFDGADKISVNAPGELVLQLNGGEIRQPKPEIYQMIGGERKEIDGGYKILDMHTVVFQIGKFDRTLPLVIDPIIGFSTYFGGNSGEAAWSVAVNPDDSSIYIAGQTVSSKFTGGAPFSTPGAFQPGFKGGKLTGDAFVAQLDSTGTNLIYLTYLGGSADDGAFSVAVNNAGNAFVTGFTDSKNFPTTAGAIQPTIGGKLNPRTRFFPVDAFVAELDPSGSNLIYSTYLGGSAEDAGIGIAVDSADNAYVTGLTTSKNFPLESPFQDNLAGTQNAFVTEIAANGTALVFSTYFGGSKSDEGEGIAVDGGGNIYVTGFTGSADFPTNNAQFPLLNNGVKKKANGKKFKINNDAFVSKFMPSGAGLLYSTFLGGAENDLGLHIAIDSAENAYVTGSSASSDFPNTNTITGTNTVGLSSQLTTKKGTDAFLTKFDPSGALIYSMPFGGKTNEVGYGVAVDALGDAFVVGATSSSDFPIFLPPGSDVLLSTNKSGKFDAFVTAFNADASALLYSAFLGGKSSDFGYGIAVDSASDVYIVGQTSSTDFPATNAFHAKRSGTNDAFIIKILAP